MARDDVRTARKLRHIAAWTVFSSLVLLDYVVPADWLRRNPDVEIPVRVAAYAVIVWWTIATVVASRRSRREAREARTTGRWPLGKAYFVAADYKLDGVRRGAELTIGETEIVIESIDPDLSLLAGKTVRMAIADVSAVCVRSTWIEIATADERVRVVPSSYQDRQRLLWELAVRCNAAVERGIDEAAAAERKQAQPHPPTAPAEPVVRVTVDPSQSTDLDRAMTGLGSALAGPMAPRNPAPPRKSGLGVGLFPAPPEA